MMKQQCMAKERSVDQFSGKLFSILGNVLLLVLALGCNTESNPYPEGQTWSANEPPKVIEVEPKLGIYVQDRFDVDAKKELEFFIDVGKPADSEVIIELVDMPEGSEFVEEKSRFRWVPKDEDSIDKSNPQVGYREYVIKILAYAEERPLEKTEKDIRIFVHAVDYRAWLTDLIYAVEEGKSGTIQMDIIDRVFPEGPYSFHSITGPKQNWIRPSRIDKNKVTLKYDIPIGAVTGRSNYGNIGQFCKKDSKRAELHKWEMKLINPQNKVKSFRFSTIACDSRQQFVERTANRKVSLNFEYSKVFEDPNNESRPNIKVLNGQNIDFAILKTRITFGESKYSRKLNVDMRGVPRSMIGEKFVLKTEVCTTSRFTEAGYNQCVPYNIEFKFNDESRFETYLTRNGRQIGKKFYLKEGEEKKFKFNNNYGNKTAVYKPVCADQACEQSIQLKSAGDDLSVVGLKAGNVKFKVQATSSYGHEADEEYEVVVISAQRKTNLLITANKEYEKLFRSEYAARGGNIDLLPIDIASKKDISDELLYRDRVLVAGEGLRYIDFDSELLSENLRVFAIYPDKELTQAAKDYLKNEFEFGVEFHQRTKAEPGEVARIVKSSGSYATWKNFPVLATTEKSLVLKPVNIFKRDGRWSASWEFEDSYVVNAKLNYKYGFPTIRHEKTLSTKEKRKYLVTLTGVGPLMFDKSEDAYGQYKKWLLEEFFVNE